MNEAIAASISCLMGLFDAGKILVDDHPRFLDFSLLVS
jgi:hypothetical protein